MKRHERFLTTTMPSAFYWFNEPVKFRLGQGLELFTDDKTDFWQRTHYGFQVDNGHCCFINLSGDWSIKTHATYVYRALYDQCGLVVRADAQTWIKLSVEKEQDTNNRLGSVVTNLGYSDWATQDIPTSQIDMYYRISKRGNDFLLESSVDNLAWIQMRVTHLHQIPDELSVGLYACSPISGGFRSHFEYLEISDNEWYLEGN